MPVKTAKVRAALNKAKRAGWSSWIRSENDERAVLNGCYFDIESAEYVFEFFPRFLTHSKGKWAGKPFDLLRWQTHNLLGPLFGWKRPDDTRRFREVFVSMGKKNGKSETASGIGTLLLVADGEEGAEVYSAATKRDQAAIVHDEAVKMVKASDDLYRRLKINHSTKVITDETTQSKYAALASDAEGVEGINAHGIIIDELHAWKGRQFWDALKYAGSARSQPIKLVITTAGVYDKASIGWIIYEDAKRVMEDRVIDPDMLVYICEADKADDPLDPETHKKANPSYGEIIQPEEIAKAARDAMEKPTERNGFWRYRLNVWTEQLEAFFDLEDWDACGGEICEEQLAGRACFGGLDLASTDDIAAWVLLFPPIKEDPIWRVLPRFFVPETVANRRERLDSVPYATWGRAGFIDLTPDNEIDYNRIKATIESDGRTFDITDVGADPWNFNHLRQRLVDDGSTVEFLEYSQGIKNMSPPMKELRDVLLKGHKIAHGNNPVLRWMAANVVADDDTNGNIRPNKKTSKEKIDGIVALIMALGRAMVSEGGKQSVYAGRDMIVV